MMFRRDVVTPKYISSADISFADDIKGPDAIAGSIFILSRIIGTIEPNRVANIIAEHSANPTTAASL